MGKQLSLFTTCFVALYWGILKYQAGEILIIFLIAYCPKHHYQYQDKKFYWKTNLRQTQSQ